MSDIVERLLSAGHGADADDAAHTIERLQAELAEAVGLLRRAAEEIVDLAGDAFFPSADLDGVIAGLAAFLAKHNEMGDLLREYAMGDDDAEKEPRP